MSDYKQNEDRKAATLNDPLTESGSLAKFASPLANSSVPSLLEHSIRQIKCQGAADITFELIRGGQQQPDFLETTLAALAPDCKSAFLRQLAKRIEGAL